MWRGGKGAWPEGEGVGNGKHGATVDRTAGHARRLKGRRLAAADPGSPPHSYLSPPPLLLRPLPPRRFITGHGSVWFFDLRTEDAKRRSALDGGRFRLRRGLNTVTTLWTKTFT